MPTTTNNSGDISPSIQESPDLKKPIVESVQSPKKPELIKPADAIIFATDYFKKLGLAVCSECGSKKQTDGGKVICAIGRATKCPMVEGEKYLLTAGGK